MEVPAGKRNKMIVCIYEAIGSGLLVYSINICGRGPPEGSPFGKFGISFTLFALILIAGLAGWLGGEVRELPDVDSPVITISTDYPGAAPETIDREITAAVEGAAWTIR